MLSYLVFFLAVDLGSAQATPPQNYQECMETDHAEFEVGECVAMGATGVNFTQAETTCLFPATMVAPINLTHRTILKDFISTTIWLNLRQDPSATDPKQGWYWLDHYGNHIPHDPVAHSAEWKTGEPDDGDGVENHYHDHAILANDGLMADKIDTKTFNVTCHYVAETVCKDFQLEGEHLVVEAWSLKSLNTTDVESCAKECLMKHPPCVAFSFKNGECRLSQYEPGSPTHFTSDAEALAYRMT